MSTTIRITCEQEANRVEEQKLPWLASQGDGGWKSGNEGQFATLDSEFLFGRVAY